MPVPDYNPASNDFSSGDDFPSTATGVTLPGGVDAVEADYSYVGSADFGTIVNTSWGGKEKRTAKVPKRLKFNITFDQLTPTDADTLFHHFLAQEGQLYAFSYFEYLSEEEFTCRYDMPMMDRETFLFEAEKVGLQLIEVL
jgi:hypothetical protein